MMLMAVVLLAIIPSALPAAGPAAAPKGNEPVYPEAMGGDFPVTFVELGSVGCIPCDRMKPVMKAIEEEYAGKVRVVFYDVRKDYRPAERYKINLIPTQVFVDKEGKEFFRHQGFYSKEEIVALLKTRGL
jgi:thioredoxin 1